MFGRVLLLLLEKVRDRWSKFKHERNAIYTNSRKYTCDLVIFVALPVA